MTSIYKSYCEFLQSTEPDKLMTNFKSEPRYKDILEHVRPELGNEYLVLLKKVLPLPVIADFCSLNDRLGLPEKSNYKEIGQVSPTSLRYLFQAHLILSHMKNIECETPSVVEVGCGYGGLCQAINFLSSTYGIKVRSYSMIDMPEVLPLLWKYQSHHPCAFPLSFHSSEKFGSDVEGNELFLISNYCLCEIPPPLREKYIETLLPRCSHAFLVWTNATGSLPILKEGQQVEAEHPQPGTSNLYVRY